MASVPPCGLKCLGKKAVDYLTEQKANCKRLSLFYLLAIEVISLFIRNVKNYACYWYPLMTQIGFFLVVFTFLMYRERLRFCLRKKLAVAFLSLYYLFGVIALVFQFTDKVYFEWTSIGVLVLSVLLFGLSFFNQEP